MNEYILDEHAYVELLVVDFYCVLLIIRIDYTLGCY